ncbi:3760_t:CDS:2, partial [Racocetra persica]
SSGIGSGLSSEKRTGKGSKLNENHLTFGPLVDGMIEFDRNSNKAA